jgi:hypothetical protein
MAVTNFSPLLGLALPTTGDLTGEWGTTVNNAITGLLDSSIAGTTTLSANSDVTLSTTNGAANQARNAVILWTASNGATTRTITAPAQSKAYVVINAGTGSIIVKGSGTVSPYNGVTISSGTKALVAWNGTDFVNISSSVFSGVISVEGTAASGAAIRLFEDTDNGTNYIALQAPAALATNVTLTLPDNDGANTQVLTTDGAGVLSWTDSGGSVTGAGGAILINNTTIGANYTIAAGTNGFSVGPITISSGYAVTVTSGQRWAVI